jgi:hypothetical protein
MRSASALALPFNSKKKQSVAWSSMLIQVVLFVVCQHLGNGYQLLDKRLLKTNVQHQCLIRAVDGTSTGEKCFAEKQLYRLSIKKELHSVSP